MADCKEHAPEQASMLKRSTKKKPIEIFVSAGSFDDPAYTFFKADGQAIKRFKINPKKVYTFKRLNEASTHPFYISDTGVKQKSSKAIKLKGDGDFNEGITGDQTFSLSFQKKYRSQIADSGKL